MWALLSSLFFDWNWYVEELIIPPRYWFVPCIMVYYVIFYIIRTFFMNHLKWVFTIFFMRVYYFLFMLLGAMTAISKRKERTPLRAGVYTIISVGLYYVCMGSYKLDSTLCRFQLISLMPLLSTIYWLFVFCDAAKVARIFDKSWMGRPVYFISTLTLEVYMVQYALFTDRFNDIFPWNILLTYIVIFLIAYFLKCSSNLFSLLFKEDRITWEKVCQV